MKQCDNGHFYDEARFESCPYCKENTGIGKTMAAADIGKTVAAFPGNPAAAAATAFDSGKTVAVMKKKIGIDPAVGFLICIEGPHRGTDFRLVSGRNFIGRAAAMDVSLPDGSGFDFCQKVRRTEQTRRQAPPVHPRRPAPPQRCA